MTGPEPTDDQLGLLVRGIATITLEVERGLRPPDHLVPLLAPQAWLRWRTRFRGSQPGLGPVQARDLGPVQLDRRGDQALATITTRTEPDRWAALTFRLRTADDGRWAVVDLQRLFPGRHFTRTTASQPPPAPSIEQRMHRLVQERALAVGALDAITQRLAELPISSPLRPTTAETKRGWQRIVRDYDRELDDLRARHHHRAENAQRLRRR